MQASQELFKAQVRDILIENCLNCHGGDATEAELDISTRAGLLAGGKSGAAVSPGKAQESLLYKLVAHQAEPAMPYFEEKLPDDAVSAIAEWINSGAAYDKPLLSEADATAWTRKTVSPNAKAHWAFQPLQAARPPTTTADTWSQTPVDQFVFAKMHAAGLTPGDSASRRQLIRRLYLDVLGIPPKPADVDSFLSDKRPGAYERLVDNMLANPRFGERWARHWLDLVRFGESHGFEHDYDRPTAYHYRDFVIAALNADMPYDQFVSWQLAGDELAPDDTLAWQATGYLAAGVHSTQITKNEVEKHRYDELDDIVGNIGTTTLGLTAGCARCHDHKFDAIPQRDYYEMVAVFTTTVRAEVEHAMPDAWYASRPNTAPSKGTAKMLVASEGLKPIRLHSQGVDFFPESYYLRRGDAEQKDGTASANYLQVLMPELAAETSAKPCGGTDANSVDHNREDLTAKDRAAETWRIPPPPDAKTSFRRASFAAWLTDTDSGAGHLLARVIVNRVWQHYLGRGIVATPSDFGIRGAAPTHPELLDWLAAELIRNNWRLKPIHRLILTSATYRQSSEFDGANAKLDPDNRLFWRPVSQRLEAEVVRDAMLAVADELDARMFGPGTLDANHRRRSIYFTVKRSKLTPVLQAFDAPDALSGIGQRATTTVAPQALHLMNNAETRASATAFAARLMETCEPELQTAAELTNETWNKLAQEAYQAAFARLATQEELAAAQQFLQAQAESYRQAADRTPNRNALTDFCQALLCANEFLYSD